MNGRLMKRIVTAFALGVSLLLTACQPPQQVEEAETGNTVQDSPAVWVAKDNDSKLFLLGSLPMVKSDARWDTPAISLAANQAKTVFIEVDTSDAAAMRSMMLTQELGFYQDGTKLSELLDDNGQKLLNLSLQRSEMAPGALDNFKPWFAAILLGVAAGEGAELVDDPMTAELVKDAELDGAKIEFLISPEQQVRGLADLTDQAQLKYLDRTLSDFSALGDRMVETAEAWQKGDVGKLKTDRVNVRTQMPSSAYQKLVKDRNGIYIGKLVNFMEGTGTGLAIVEMSHLVDQGNLQAMLRDRGYKVERYYGVD